MPKPNRKFFNKKAELLLGRIGGGENRTGMVMPRFSIDKSNKIPHQFTQILRTRRGKTSCLLASFSMVPGAGRKVTLGNTAFYSSLPSQ